VTAMTTFLPFVDCQKLGARFSCGVTAVAALTNGLLQMDEHEEKLRFASLPLEF
jgi:hypothetical protein